MLLVDYGIQKLEDTLVIGIQPESFAQSLACVLFLAHEIEDAAQVVLGIFVVGLLSNGLLVHLNGLSIIVISSQCIAEHDMIDWLALI